MNRNKSCVILCIVVLLLAGCNDSGLGIFYSVSIEEPFEDNTSLENDLSVSRLFAVADELFALAGALRVGTPGSDGQFTWAELSHADDGTGELTISAAYAAGDLYVVTASSDTATGTLYLVSPSSDSGLYSGDGISIASVDVDGDAGTTLAVVDIAESDSDLMVNVRFGMYEYLTYASSDGSLFVELSRDVPLSPVKESLGFSGNTYLLTGGRLQSDESGGFSVVTENGSPGVGETELADVFVSSALDALFVLATDGTLYARTSVGWLSPIELFDGDLDADRTVRLGEASFDTGETVLLVGTDSGYFELVFDNGIDQTTFDGVASSIQEPGKDAVVTTSGTDYSIVDLSSSPVLDIDVVGTTLFIATAGSGLWRTEYQDSEKRWSRE